MSIAADERLLTIAEYLAMPDGGRCSELVRGRVVEMNPPSSTHGYFCLEFGSRLREFVRKQQLGRVIGNDSGVVTERDPDTVRGADVAFYSYERVPKGLRPQGYWPAPDLAVEVLSPGDRTDDVREKVAEYLRAGVTAVVVVDPVGETIRVHRANREVELFHEADAFVLPDLLPGFAFRVDEFFSE